MASKKIAEGGTEVSIFMPFCPKMPKMAVLGPFLLILGIFEQLPCPRPRFFLKLYIKNRSRSVKRYIDEVLKTLFFLKVCAHKRHRNFFFWPIFQNFDFRGPKKHEHETKKIFCAFCGHIMLKKILLENLHRCIFWSPKFYFWYMASVKISGGDVKSP